MFFLFGKKLKYQLDLLKLYENENIILKNDVVFLRQQLEEERLERRRLTDMILIRTGYITSEPNTNNSNLNPIGKETLNWPRLRNKLEMESARNLNIKSNVPTKDSKNNEELLKELDVMIAKGEEKMDASN